MLMPAVCSILQNADACSMLEPVEDCSLQYAVAFSMLEYNTRIYIHYAKLHDAEPSVCIFSLLYSESREC